MKPIDEPWNAAAEIGFNAWFHGDISPWTLRSEYFYGDCQAKDEKTLQDLMIGWLHAAYCAGFAMANGDETAAKPAE